MSSKAIPVDRGCGVRVRGGVYLEIGVGADGVDLHRFLVDHPLRLPMRELGITPRGVHIIDDPWDTRASMLIDWIGSQHYPNVLDFLTEARMYGISRRLPRNFPFESLHGISIGFVHSRAAVENPEAFWANPQVTKTYCPTGNAVHQSPAYRSAGGPCAGFWWEDVEGGIELDPEMGNRVVRREMPSFRYLARRRPDTADPIYAPALFLVMRPGRLVYVEERPGEGIPAELAARMASSGFDVEAVQE